MGRYLIETPHTENTCKLLYEQVEAMGYLHNFEWGCEAGIHSGWTFIEADDEAQARLVVPLLVRDEAKVIPVVKFSPEMLKKHHPGVVENPSH